MQSDRSVVLFSIYSGTYGIKGVTNREYYGRAATSIENKCKIEYGTEQGLAALIYGEKGLSSLPIQDIAGEHIDTDNEYMYYYSVEFIK